MWQRVCDPETKTMAWVRSSLNQVKIKDVAKGSSAPFGFTPRSSVSRLDFDRSLSFAPSQLEEQDEKGGNSTQNPVHALMNAAGEVFSPRSEKRHVSKDSFGDSVFYSSSPGFTSVFDEEGGLVWKKVESGVPLSPLPAARAAAEERVEYDLANIAAYTFRDKLAWFLDRMSELQKPWTEGFVRIEIRRNRVLDDSFRAWMQLSEEDLHKWMRYQFRGKL